MTCVIGKNSITCYRGGCKPTTGKVRDRQGREWGVMITKEQFDKAVSVEVRGGSEKKKVLREYLTWIE